ncbi:MAG: PDZ domain-containing protein [Magnetococcus sp. WYHC-3]
MKGMGINIVAVGLLVLVVVVLASMFDLPGSDLSVTPPPTEMPAGYPIAMTRMVPAAAAGFSATAPDPGWGDALQPAPVALDPNTPQTYVAANIQLSEAHWQGMEALPLSDELKKKLKLPAQLTGLMVDEVSLAAGASGVMAGDVLLAVNGRKVESLRELQAQSRLVQMDTSVTLTVYRQGKILTFTMADTDNLGLAQVETAPMILPGDIMPHAYRGPCTQCHAIGASGHIVPDPDGIILPPGPIQAGAAMPHADRGPCVACHIILQ